MAYTQADIDVAKQQLADGIAEVREDGTHVVFHSATELRRTIAIMEAEVNAIKPSGFRRVRVRKGRYE